MSFKMAIVDDELVFEADQENVMLQEGVDLVGPLRWAAKVGLAGQRSGEMLTHTETANTCTSRAIHISPRSDGRTILQQATQCPRRRLDAQLE